MSEPTRTRRDWPRYRDGGTEPPQWVRAVRSWCVVHESRDLSMLGGFDVVVVMQPARALTGWLTPQAVDHLRSRGIRLLAHVPLVRGGAAGELVRPEVGAGLRPEPWFLTAVSRVRAASSGPWDGCYLDDLDLVLGHTDGSSAAVELAAIAREASRGGIVVGQAVTDPVVTAAVDLVGAPAALT